MARRSTLRKRTCRRGGDGYVGGRNYKRTARRKARGGNDDNDGSVGWYNRHYGTNYKS